MTLRQEEQIVSNAAPSVYDQCEQTPLLQYKSCGKPHEVTRIKQADLRHMKMHCKLALQTMHMHLYMHLVLRG